MQVVTYAFLTSHQEFTVDELKKSYLDDQKLFII